MGRIIYIAMGLGLLFGIFVLYPDMKVALDAIISTLLTILPISSTFAELIFTTMPIWGLGVLVICAILLMVGGGRGRL